MIFSSFPDNDITKDDTLYIREIQELLRALEMNNAGASNVPIDGVYGPQTATAVEEFQRKQGLPCTGVVDRTTYYKIIEQYNVMAARNLFTLPIRSFPEVKDYTLRLNDANDSVYFLNIMLCAIATAFKNIPVPVVETVYNNSTEASVRALQSTMGIAATGVTNRQTWNGITDLYNRLINGTQQKNDTTM